MTSLLHLDSSANQSSESISRRLTGLFASMWRARNGSTGYRYRDLAADPVPPLDTAYCTLGRRAERHGLVPLTEVGALVEGPAEERQWALTHPLITEVRTADTVLIGAPMYNYGIPAALKSWIDRISFPGAFTDPRTGNSHLNTTKIVVIGPRGGAYGPESPQHQRDFHAPYLRAYFDKQGVPAENLSFIHPERTLADLVPHLARYRPEAETSLATARARVTDLATRADNPART